MKEDLLIEKLFDTYRKTFYLYNHVDDVRDLELLAFTHGIWYILLTLKIDLKEVSIKNSDLQEEINRILERFKVSELEKTEEDKLHDFIHDKDDVGFREYVPSGERNSI